MTNAIKRLAFNLMCRRFRERRLLDKPSAWYKTSKPLLWAYGGGTLRRYGNAAEDIDDSINKGFRVIELDFARTNDGVPVASHFFKPEDSLVEWDHIPSSKEFLEKKVNGRFTPLRLVDVITRYIQEDVFFSLDPFYYYCNVPNGESEFLDYVVRNTNVHERRRLILQIYSFKMLCHMKDNNCDIGALHYVIGEGCFWKVKHLVKVLTSVGVHSVSFQDTVLTPEIFNAIAILRAANIHVSVAGVNTMARYKEVIAAGADCVNTMVLVPKEVSQCVC